jgi:hypothetical protein
VFWEKKRRRKGVMALERECVVAVRGLGSGFVFVVVEIGEEEEGIVVLY